MNREHAMGTFSLVPACSTSSLGRRGTVDGIFCFSPRSLCLSLYDRPVQPATTCLGHFTFCFSPRSLCLSYLLFQSPVTLSQSLRPASSTSNNISRSFYLLFQSPVTLSQSLRPASSTSKNISRSLYLLFQSPVTLSQLPSVSVPGHFVSVFTTGQFNQQQHI